MRRTRSVKWSSFAYTKFLRNWRSHARGEVALQQDCLSLRTHCLVDERAMNTMVWICNIVVFSLKKYPSVTLTRMH